MTKHHDRDQEPSEASPPTTNPAAAPAAPEAGAPLKSINEPGTPSTPTGDLPSINEPPGPAHVGQEKSAQVTDVSRETDHGNKRHR
jgi:hypothetical protein